MKQSTWQLHMSINLKAMQKPEKVFEMNKKRAHWPKPSVPLFEGSFEEFKKVNNIV